MTRTATIYVALLVAASVALADDFVIIRADVPATTALEFSPLIASTDAEGLRQAMETAQLPQGALYAEDIASGQSLSAQLNLIGDRAQFAALLPNQPAGRREIRVWLQNAPHEPSVPDEQVSLAREGDAVVVGGPTYEVRHDPARNIGILSQITFPETGNVFTPSIGDRLYSKEAGGFYLRNDPRAELEVAADGPLMVEVRVSARYVSGAGAVPETEPQAVYALRYWAGLPVVAIEAQVTQERPAAWNELHFLEIQFKDDSFTHFAQDDPSVGIPFTDDKQGHRSPRWGALVEGPNVLGMTGNTLIYDGLNDYGRYLHGPWEAWTTDRIDHTRWLLISSEDEALQALDAVASGTVGAGNAVVLTEGLLVAFDELATTAQDWMLRSDQRGLLAGALNWRVTLLRAALEQGRPVNEVLTAARQLQELAADDPSRAATWLPPTAEGRLLLADDGKLGVGLLQTGTGIQLASLYDMVAGREMLAAGSELFRISLTDGDGNPASLASSDGWSGMRASASGNTAGAAIEASFERPLQDGLSNMIARLTCAISGGESRWSLSVENDTRWSIDAVTLPELHAVRIGNSQSDDSLYVPQGYGREYPDGMGARYVGYYPSGTCALPMLLVSDETSGLYLCTHDADASARMINSDNATSLGIPLDIEEPAPNASVAGNDFATAGDVVIARVDGGWYPATQKYRAWLQESAPWWPEGDPDYGRPDRPEWLNDIAAWVLTSGGPENVVEPTRRFREYMGLPCAIHWYSWHQIPFDNDYPHYFPTKEGFREGVAELQEAGVRVTPYINGRLWDTDTESFQQTAFQYATRDRDGEPYIEVYGSGERLAAMCIATEFWRETLHEIVMRLMTEFNVDGVYMDQIGAARPRLCFDPSHGHPLSGGGWWTDGYWTLLERIQEDIAEVSPDKMLTTESNAEAYARWFDTYLMCNSLGDGLVPLFPAVYGSKVLGFGRYMSAEDWDAPESLAQKQGQLFIWGTQLWWSQPGVIDHAFAGPWLRDLVRLRYSVREFFNEGRMLPPPALEGNDRLVRADWHRRDLSATMPAVIATTWGVADGRILIPMVNVSQERQTVTLGFDPRSLGLEAGAAFTAERIGPRGASALGTWTGYTRHEIALDGVEPAALLLTPLR